MALQRKKTNSESIPPRSLSTDILSQSLPHDSQIDEKSRGLSMLDLPEIANMESKMSKCLSQPLNVIAEYDGSKKLRVASSPVDNPPASARTATIRSASLFNNSFRNFFKSGRSPDPSITKTIRENESPRSEDKPSDDDISETSSGFPQTSLKAVHLLLSFEDTTIPLDIRQDLRVIDTLEIAFSLLDIKDKKLEEYVIYKNDRNSPLLRSFLSQQQEIWALALEDNDRIGVSCIKEKKKMSFIIPPSKEVNVMEYCVFELASHLIERAVKLYKAQQQGNYNLYHKRYGCWFEESRQMLGYNLEEEDIIELRELSEQALLRIDLPEFNTRITLRVLPSLTCGDVIGMVQYNLKNREFELNTSPDLYGLFVKSSNIWMRTHDIIGDYDILSKDCGVQYKQQYCTIHVTCASSNFTATTALIDRNVTVEDLMNIITMDNYEFKNLSLCTQTGDILKSSTNLWELRVDTMEDQLACKDQKPLYLQSSLDPDEVLMNVDFLETLSSLLPVFSRRFGLKPKDIKKMHIKFPFAEVDMSRSLMEQNISEKSCIVLEVDSGLPLQTEGGNDSRTEDQKNIWEIPEASQNVSSHTFTNKKDFLASPAQLIQKLTDTSLESNFYLEFLNTFLTTYEAFMTSEEVLRRLIERYHVPRSYPEPYAAFKSKMTTIQLRVCNVIQLWLKRYSWRFQGTEREAFLLDDIQNFIEKVVANDHSMPARQVKKYIKKLKSSESNLGDLQESNPLKITTMDPSFKSNPLQYEAMQIADQLTLFEFATFEKIKPSELLNQMWNRADAKLKAPNVFCLCHQFNVIASWVATSILLPKSPSARAKRMAKFIDIGEYLLKLNNFSSLMAIVAGMNKAAILRLKNTMKELSSKHAKKLKDMERLMNAENSYKTYRTHLHSVDPPCIPYLGVYLIDLVYIEDGNPDRINGLINVAKLSLVSSIIREIQQYQQKRYTIAKSQPLFMLLDRVTVSHTENYLYELSLKQEPRGGGGGGGKSG